MVIIITNLDFIFYKYLFDKNLNSTVFKLLIFQSKSATINDELYLRKYETW